MQPIEAWELNTATPLSVFRTIYRTLGVKGLKKINTAAQGAQVFSFAILLFHPVAILN